MSIRPILENKTSSPVIEGAGVRLDRAFGFGNTNQFDPFLLLDDFRNENPNDYLKGFPWHPHRGIETIAYMLEGECTLFHGEQLENQTLIKQGEQIFIPDNVPHAPYNLSDRKCVWVVVHSSGDDQDELVRTTELDYILENFGG